MIRIMIFIKMEYLHVKIRTWLQYCLHYTTNTWEGRKSEDQTRSSLSIRFHTRWTRTMNYIVLMHQYHQRMNGMNFNDFDVSTMTISQNIYFDEYQVTYIRLCVYKVSIYFPSTYLSFYLSFHLTLKGCQKGFKFTREPGAKFCPAIGTVFAPAWS